uniref:Cytochrome b5 heme-binding domain-containing protein n=1 Tax=Trieres chinensis TaxID=1514140 RepID=A0A6U1YTJ4_TRICV|mmetsp:Transcript_39330/g.80239  ORF Transcript_39330/g.80239 Transcript_39330/m.80239 type:complete len:136 (+) Transcript_39330:185-592(+)|eukprot:CAMPEP_0183295134 /NCGR_PEP_ID=MMETSP0160_2-20130417/3199_1 /TAXON_ID=2839 ORGANISM="Odontella Sinensis, Strain Grunow 1884" /NCGR_SAMPLE_ID=MMETSP0160_2 /ASSEMBLY_ACC=CAM_ASM_000250 /LENGTH=135 /DNA_ID=CAMNT_0025456567 /DNA_START=181 /DNA_END=588 /DNA_ORIENTATION=+
MAPNTEKEYRMSEVKDHNKNDDCWLVIGNANTGGPKVYDVTSYLDDHPGGAEVMLDVGGQNADEFFEDIGHSNDAREELKKYQIGVLKLSKEEIEQMEAEAAKAKAQSEKGGNSMLIMVLVVIIAVALGYYKTQM